MHFCKPDFLCHTATLFWFGFAAWHRQEVCFRFVIISDAKVVKRSNMTKNIIHFV